MNKVMKILAVCSAIVLMLWDVFTLSDIASATGGAEIFGIVMRAMMPCGLLFGITALLYRFEKPAKKPLAVITAICFGFMALIRLFALILQFVWIAEGTEATDFSEILLIVEFAGYLLLAVAALFLMIFIIKGAMRRTALTLYSVAGAILLVDWIIVIGNQVSELLFADASVTEIFLTIFTGDFLWSVTSLIAYTISFAFITKAMETPAAKKGNA